MNRVADSNPPSGDLDVLLGTFFKGEMPAPWPAFRFPAPARSAQAPRRTPRRRLIFSSRAALAASIALLLLGAWMLGGRFAPTMGTPLPTFSDPPKAERLKHDGAPARESNPEQPKLPLPPLGKPLGMKLPGKVTTSTTLECKDGRTGARIVAEESPSDK